MKTLKLRAAIRNIIDEAKHDPGQETHLTITGKVVPFGCKTCVNDLEHRIEDAKVRRDTCPHRSDSREHYNGLLRVLRRELRSARKTFEGS
tara:strand:- start:3768 stop:4040 length:273 start_codon:yes stop_codon:yes gene_type:complete